MKTNHTDHRAAVFCLCILQSTVCLLAWAQPTAYTYQGHLKDSGAVATGVYDLRFTIYDTETGGTALGAVTHAATEVTKGVFTVDLDFGPGMFDGSERWLEIGAVTNGGGAFSILSPRQHITSAPYAVRARIAHETEVALGVAPNSVFDETVIDGSLFAVDLAPDQVVKSLNGLRDDVELVGGPNILLSATPGTPATITLSSSDDWKLGGNVGTTPGIDFVGTTDDQPLEFRVSGQRALRLEPTTAAPNVIGGDDSSSVSPGSEGAFIGGGSEHTAQASYSVIAGGSKNTNTANYSVIAGGNMNRIGWTSHYSTVGGGSDNNIESNAMNATIGGGAFNDILDGASSAAIGGGYNNSIGSNCLFSVVGGGGGHLLRSNAWAATIAGGLGNHVGRNSGIATIGGGQINNIQGDSLGASIFGGFNNYIGTNSGFGTICGGNNNSISDNAGYAVILGGDDNSVGPDAPYAFAAGRRARAFHEGAFVWADARDANYFSTRTNEFSIRAEGGVRIDSKLGIKLNDINQPLITRGPDLFTSGKNEGVGRWGLFKEAHRLVLGMPAIAGEEVVIVKYAADSSYTTLVTITQNGDLYTTGSVNPPSDRAVKQDFASVNPREVLKRVVALPLQSWAYTNSPQIRHLGPVAQDFHAAFGLGTDNKHIATVDADGVALAAIQGLNLELEQKDARIAKMEQELAELKRLIRTLSVKVNGGSR